MGEWIILQQRIDLTARKCRPQLLCRGPGRVHLGHQWLGSEGTRRAYRDESANIATHLRQEATTCERCNFGHYGAAGHRNN